MSKEDAWNWAEYWFREIPLPYLMVATFIGFIIYIGYVFFGIMIHKFPFSFYAQLSAISICILMAYELAGIKYLLNIMRSILSYWSLLFPESVENICMIAKKRFTKSYWYYILLFSVIMLFYLIDWIPPSGKNLIENFMKLYLPIYSHISHTNWGLLFDIYTQLLSIIIFFFLAVILWIMVNITWTLRSPIISSTQSPRTNVFTIKMRVSSIKNLILKVLTYYFICISLAIISYHNPTIFYSKETFLLMMLLLIGILFFFLGLEAIQRVLKDSVEYELDEINKKCQEQIQRLTKIASFEDYKDKDNEINYSSKLLNAFQKQRDQLEQINTNLYTPGSIARFTVHSFCLS
jgi:hypothetical protein